MYQHFWHIKNAKTDMNESRCIQMHAHDTIQLHYNAKHAHKK
jgi:hypothetical protein